MSTDISISKDGIRLSYRRFLADSAAGFLFVLVLCFVPFISCETFGYSLAAHLTAMAKEVRILAVVLLFILATPLGFVFNAIGWLLLEQTTTIVERFLFAWCEEGNSPFSVLQVSVVRNRPEVINYFALNRHNFGTVAWLMRDVLETYVPARVEAHYHVRGLVIFIQNLTVFSLLSGVGALLADSTGKDSAVCVLVGGASLFVLLVGPWTSPNKSGQGERAAIAVLLLGLTVGAFFFAMQCNNSFWPTACFVAALFLGWLAAAVSFYHHAAILVAAYLVCHELGLESACLSKNGDDRAFEIAKLLVTEIKKTNSVADALKLLAKIRPDAY